MNPVTEAKVPRLMVALDTDGPGTALAMARKLQGLVPVVKVGPVVLSLDTGDIVRLLKDLGFQVFVDVKLHDIPNTVEHSVRGWEKRGADFLTLHASGGRQMLTAAAGAASKVKLLAVTVLTSLSPGELEELGWGGGPEDLRGRVLKFGKMAGTAGITGLVSSLQEAPMLRRELGTGTTLVCPGLRLPGAEKDDQSRAGSPEEAARSGADYLVVGRPVLKAKDPAEAVRQLQASLVLSSR